jgi:hypothetical protein
VNTFIDRHSDTPAKGVALRPEEPLMAPTAPAKRKRDFNPKKFLATIG